MNRPLMVLVGDFHAADARADKLESLLRAVVEGWRNDQLAPQDAPQLWDAANAADDYLGKLDVERATAEYEARNAGVTGLDGKAERPGDAP